MTTEKHLSPAPVFDQLLNREEMLSPVWQSWFLDLYNQIQVLQHKIYLLESRE